MKTLSIFLIFAACAAAAQNDRAGLQPGTLAEPWLTGGPNCLTVPDWQVHEYNEDFYILRESGCINAEKPFLYLIFGEKKALLEDTGVANRAPTKSCHSHRAGHHGFNGEVGQRKNHAPVSLVVIHSHSHGDHTAADAQFNRCRMCSSSPPLRRRFRRRRGSRLGPPISAKSIWGTASSM